MSGSISATSVMAVSLAATAASTAVAMEGAQTQGEATANADRYQAQVAQNNSAIASQNATLAGQAGAQQVGMANQRTKAAVGAITAGEAGAGVDVAGPSAVAVQDSQKDIGMQDALQIRSNAARTAYGYETQASGFQSQAALDNMGAANASDVSTAMAGDAFSGIGSASNGWANFTAKNGLGTAGSTVSPQAQAFIQSGG